MGRHSSPKQWAYYRSVVGWFLPWVLIAAVVGVAVWFAVDAVSNDDNGGVPVARASHSPSATSSPSKKRTPTPEESTTPDPAATEVELITEGISVQVLNATDVDDAEERMAARLTDLGFTVSVQAQASTRYSETTVFWSNEGSKDAAVRLAGRFGWVALPKPDNLSAEVSIHVVVGEDEA